LPSLVAIPAAEAHRQIIGLACGSTSASAHQFPHPIDRGGDQQHAKAAAEQ
jgi:hypothetical protein